MHDPFLHPSQEIDLSSNSSSAFQAEVAAAIDKLWKDVHVQNAFKNLREDIKFPGTPRSAASCLLLAI